MKWRNWGWGIRQHLHTFSSMMVWVVADIVRSGLASSSIGLVILKCTGGNIE
jgi:hypothetical protein